MVRDSPHNGVLGMNIIQERFWELFVQHGPALFNFVLQAPTQIQQNLQQYHQVQANEP